MGRSKKQNKTKTFSNGLKVSFFVCVSVCLSLCLSVCSLQGRLPVPKEVNRKKMEEISAASLTPEGSYELCSPNISYLYSF